MLRFQSFEQLSDSQRLHLRREGVRFVIAVIAGAAAIAALVLALPFG
jgi:hypothetical protein